MRKINIVWLLLATLCGAILFHTSQKVTDGKTRIEALEQGTNKERESIRVLQAEWSYLSQPDRLEKLARAHLELTPMTGKQFIAADDLDTLAAPEEPAKKETAQIVKTAAPKPAAPKTIDEKAPVVKPAVAAQQPVLRLVKPPVNTAAAPAPVTRKPPLLLNTPPQPEPAPAKTAEGTGNSFNDLIKNLGVR